MIHVGPKWKADISENQLWDLLSYLEVGYTNYNYYEFIGNTMFMWLFMKNDQSAGFTLKSAVSLPEILMTISPGTAEEGGSRKCTAFHPSQNYSLWKTDQKHSSLTHL